MISWSAYEQFALCERQYYYQRVEKIPRPSNEYLEIGSAYHAAIAARLRGEKFLQVRPDLVEEIRHNLDRLQTFVFPHLRIQAVEQWFDSDKIDLLSGTIPVVDYRGQAVGCDEGRCVIDFKVLFKKRKMERNRGQPAHYCLTTGIRWAAFVEIPRDLSEPIFTTVMGFQQWELDHWRERFEEADKRILELRGKPAEDYGLVRQGHPLCSSKWCFAWDQCPGGKIRG